VIYDHLIAVFEKGMEEEEEQQLLECAAYDDECRDDGWGTVLGTVCC
jgi:hypothetical protein